MKENELEINVAENGFIIREKTWDAGELFWKNWTFLTPQELGIFVFGWAAENVDPSDINIELKEDQNAKMLEELRDLRKENALLKKATPKEQ